jgi:pyridoxine 4-dehydrogenase
MSIPRTAALGDHRLTRVGLGTNRLSDTSEHREFLEAAVGAGVNFIDTAHVYTRGDSERAIGATLAPFADDLVVATKGGYEPGAARPDELRAQLEASFERLRTDTIGLYYLHRVQSDVPLEETLGVLVEYREAGRIEHVGLSQVGVEQIERARALVPVSAVQNEYHLAERESDGVVDYCEREGIVFVPFHPLHGQPPTRLDGIAERYAATPQQIALAWLLKRSPQVTPIPGTRSLEHLNSNLGALELELADEDYASLDAG